jgi:transposase
MKTLKLIPHLSIDELRERLKKAHTSGEFKRWQCLYLIQTRKGVTAEYLSEILCIPKPTIYFYVQTYNKSGALAIIVKPKGGRKRFYLNLKQETDILNTLSKEAKQGQIITAKDVKKEIEKKIGHAVSDDYLWDLFHRHNWKKKKPRPKHPKSKKEEQEAFKKNLRMAWMPPE